MAPMHRAAVCRPIVVRCRAHPTQKDVDAIEVKVEEAIKEAETICAEKPGAPCAVAWDNVEELSAASAHKKVALKADPVSNDPLEAFCEDNPDADECRVYED